MSRISILLNLVSTQLILYTGGWSLSMQHSSLPPQVHGMPGYRSSAWPTTRLRVHFSRQCRDNIRGKIVWFIASLSLSSSTEASSQGVYWHHLLIVCRVKTRRVAYLPAARWKLFSSPCCLPWKHIQAKFVMAWKLPESAACRSFP